MRVNGFGPASIEDRERTKTEAPSSAPAAKPANQDSVVVASGAQEINAVAARQAAARTEKVAAVRAQVQSGTYKVDRDKLADKLADDELARAGER